MTKDEKKILGMVVLDPDAWVANAINVFGEEKADEVLKAKVAKYQAQYDEAIANGTYKTRVQAQADYEASPEYLAEQQAMADRLARQQAKMQSFIDNLPSWAVVSTAVDNIGNLADAKVFIKKLARIVYWLAKDQEN